MGLDLFAICGNFLKKFESLRNKNYKLFHERTEKLPSRLEEIILLFYLSQNIALLMQF